ncbi:MAG TPA: TRAP transporter TatT component family protein [Opitutaceae bacterium]|nr:TRAP transporter TatT component family protein [Opitutaceae bacterium]
MRLFTRPQLNGIGLVVLAAGLALTGCSVRQVAVNSVGNILAKGGSGGAFASDEDPELVRAAVPFSLKLMESLLLESPEHEALLVATAGGFTQYAYAFVQQEADEAEETDFAHAIEQRLRARKLYVRARDYGLRALEVSHPGFGAAFDADPIAAVAVMGEDDVPALYWTAAAWASAISLAKDDPALIGELPQMEALIDRAHALDADYDYGAIHTFLMSYELARVGGEGDPVERARVHFGRAIELTGGKKVSPYVTWAENTCVQSQDVAEFRRLLDAALAIDVNERPEWRLENTIMQRRARRLLDQIDILFLNP